jgi:hypothetical protein
MTRMNGIVWSHGHWMAVFPGVMHSLLAGVTAGAVVGDLMVLAIAFLFALVAVWFVPLVFFLISMQGALRAVSPKNRGLSPGLVWLDLIPFFNLAWNFVVVIQVSQALKRELEERGIKDCGDCGYAIGLAMSILWICAIVPLLGGLMWVAAVVLWILYWVKVVELKDRLIRLPVT